MNYLMDAWRILYGFVVVLLAVLSMACIFIISIGVSLLFAWIFDHVMDFIFWRRK